MSNKNVLKIKVFTLGESKVGKTSYIVRFKGDTYKEDRLTTIGIDLITKLVELNNKKYYVDFYDTAGQERFRSISSNSIKSADGIILMFDLTKQKTYDQISNWMTNIRKYKGDDFPMILIGNKCDLEDKRVITKEEGIELAEKYKLKYFETSNKTGVNVKESAMEIIKKIIEIQEKDILKGFEVIENFQLEKSKTFEIKKEERKKICCKN